MAQAKKNISVIPATGTYDRSKRPQVRALRVAAYCRVSTLQEQQESSYEAQVSYYTEKIQGNPNWKLAGIYADDGKSATSTRKRSDFQAMIDDCMAGKIDLVLTKSISRFARNTVDALTNIRKLKEKNIAVFFEKENINTLEGSGELCWSGGCLALQKGDSFFLPAGFGAYTLKGKLELVQSMV